MKKISVLMVFVICALCMTACEGIAPYPFVFEEVVVRVELIDYENTDVTELYCPTIFHHVEQDKICDFDFNKMTVLETLPDERLEEFLSDVTFSSSGVFLTDPKVYYDSPQGLCTRIVYESGAFEIISYDETFAGSFDADGNVRRFIGECIGGEELVEDYFSYFEE